MYLGYSSVDIDCYSTDVEVGRFCNFLFRMPVLHSNIYVIGTEPVC